VHHAAQRVLLAQFPLRLSRGFACHLGQQELSVHLLLHVLLLPSLELCLRLL
jgi:hypothetical protein